MGRASFFALLAVSFAATFLGPVVAQPDLPGCTLYDSQHANCLRCDWAVSAFPQDGADHGGVGDQGGWVRKDCPRIAKTKNIIVTLSNGVVSPGFNQNSNCLFSAEIQAVNSDGSGEVSTPSSQVPSDHCVNAAIPTFSTPSTSNPSGAVRILKCRGLNDYTIFKGCTLQGTLSITATNN